MSFSSPPWHLRAGSVVAALFSILGSTFFYLHHREFQLDDAAIYRKVIGNVLEHGAWSYNLDVLANPLTSFLYPLLVLFIAAFLPIVDLKVLVTGLDGLFLATASFLLARFFIAQGGVLAGLLAAVGLPLLFPIGNYLGMEIALLLTGFSALLISFRSDRARTVIAALFPLIRPEGIVVLGVELLWTVARKLLVRGRTWRSEISRLLLAGIPTILMVSFNLMLFGSILPRSVGNKFEQSRHGFYSIRKFLKEFLASGYQDLPWHIPIALLVGLGIAALLLCARRYLAVWYLMIAIGLWQLGLVVVNVAFYDWYILPGIFGAYLLGIVAIDLIVRTVGGWLSRSLNSSETLQLLGSIAASGALLYTLLPEGARVVETREVAYLKTAAAIREVPKRSSDSPVPTVAIIEAGHLTLGLPSDQFRILDLIGLTTKNLPYYSGKHNDYFFCTERPEFIVASTTEPFIREYATRELFDNGTKIEIAESGKLRRSFWPHVALLTLDPRFTLNYELQSVVQSEGWPGSLPIYRLRSKEPVGCELGKYVADRIASTSASAVHAPGVEKDAFDRVFGTEWNSGDRAPQSISVQFKEPVQLSRMLLAVSQGPAGESAHQLQFFDAQGGVVHTVQLRANLSTDDTVLLTLPDVLTSRLIITTSESTSWIAWKEIWFSAVNDPGGQLTLAPF